MHIYITGRDYDNGLKRQVSSSTAHPYKMRYACFARTESDNTACNYGELLGSRPETELQVVQIALKYAYTSKEDVTVHTDFANVQKRVNGRIKATSQSAKDFAALANMVREKINIQIIEELPDRERKVLDYILDKFTEPYNEWQSCEVTWSFPPFRVVVRDRKGNVLCDLNEKHFGGVLDDAIQFANWYERESKNETSDYFGVTVERYNVPLTR